MKIEKIINEIAQENTYLLSNSSSCLVIDPGNDSDGLLSHLKILNLSLAAILLTHAHFDHIWGLPALVEQFPDVPIFLHEAEKDFPQNATLNASMTLLHQPIIVPLANHFYQIGKDYTLADFKFSVRYTPGHSIGGVSLVFPEEKVVFSGDSLFRNTIGRWDLPTGNHEQLLNSIRTEIFSLPDDYQILPGHGSVTTIHQEKHYNPFL
ncbi:MBL fold metallo-hydrolase [Lactococcus nasutitermitis]|uniref:MBL fold metallo-hydrolase n=1 Tax=Lactococcus nasutitermitis TaxID=1652957 RepID=A0ABV9JAB5_9LACT|nr:MBL fold metallo-hydrolase [Lactococcus nasutitermitis]